MFTKFLLWISGVSKAALNYITTTVVPVLKADADDLFIQLAPIALGIVTELATTGKLPNEKRDAAFAQLKSAAIAAGIAAGTSVLNKSIEDAVAVLKANSVAGN
jgi:hypothetical protein